MNIPAHVDAHWIGTLGDQQLVAADLQLHADFHQLELAEKSRTGERYVLLQGPAPLVNAWLQWVLVNNETRARGLVVRHPR
jgi:hypothetical protein